MGKSIKNIKKLLEGLRPNLEELAKLFDPDNSVCIFESEKWGNIKDLKKGKSSK